MKATGHVVSFGKLAGAVLAIVLLVALVVALVINYMHGGMPSVRRWLRTRYVGNA